MIEASSYSYEMQYEQIQDMEVVQAWRQSPFQMVGGNEVLENMRVFDGEKESDLEYRYKVWRRDILTPSFEDPTIIGILGRTGSGKGGAGMGIYRLLKHDEYLREELAEHGIELDVVPVPFSLFAEAAKLPRVEEKYPELAIDSTRLHGGYTTDEYRNISCLMWKDMHEYLKSQDSATKTVIQIESSSPTSFPKVPDYAEDSHSLLQVDGIDRGNSPVYSAAYNAETADRTYVLALERDGHVKEDAIKYRGIEQEEEDNKLRKIFYADVKVVFTPHGADEEVDVRDLSEDEQREIVQFMRKTMAPPQGLVRSDQEFEALMEQISLRSFSEKSFYNKLRNTLKMGKRQFSIVSNPHFQGGKTFDLDYFSDSLAARLYPELLPEVLRK